MVFVVDGLRPDLIDESTTPTLARLRSEGVECLDAHAEAPPVTRINGASIVTGNRPGTHGLVGNEMYWPAVREGQAFSTADAANLALLGDVDGRVLACRSLGGLLHDAGARLVTVGSGSSGSAYLLNTESTAGHGVMINTDRSRAGVPLAQPPEIEQRILATFGPPPSKNRDSLHTETMAYATAIMCDYVLPELHPDVAIIWLTEPDHANHVFGPSADASLVARRAADGCVARILQRLGSLGLLDETDVMVLSDHGFSEVSGSVDVEGQLIRAGLKHDERSADVVVAASGCAHIYVRDRDAAHIQAVTRFLQRQPWAEAILTAARHSGDPAGNGAPTDAGLEMDGWLDGTFSLALLGFVGSPREPDIVVSLPWSDRASVRGIPGDSMVLHRAGKPLTPGQHGNLSPHDIRSTMICWGPSFRANTVVSQPVGNRDVAPTLLALAGIDPTSLDGRVLDACLRGSTPTADVGQRRIHRVEVEEHGYGASVEVCWSGGRAYLSGAWNDRTSDRVGSRMPA